VAARESARERRLEEKEKELAAWVGRYHALEAHAFSPKRAGREVGVAAGWQGARGGVEGAAMQRTSRARGQEPLDELAGIGLLEQQQARHGLLARTASLPAPARREQQLAASAPAPIPAQRVGAGEGACRVHPGGADDEGGHGDGGNVPLRRERWQDLAPSILSVAFQLEPSPVSSSSFSPVPPAPPPPLPTEATGQPRKLDFSAAAEHGDGARVEKVECMVSRSGGGGGGAEECPRETGEGGQGTARPLLEGQQRPACRDCQVLRARSLLALLSLPSPLAGSTGMHT